MKYEEFEVDGKKVILNTEYSKEQTGIADLDDKEEELEKTQEFEPISKEELYSDTMTDIFGEDSNE